MGKKIRFFDGHFQGDGTVVADAVYERPVLLVYEGTFNSMDGKVQVTADMLKKLVANHNGLVATFQRALSGGLQMKDCPPLQLDHSTSARDTVGRLVGPIFETMVEIDGVSVLAVMGTARFLGADNCEKARDGRYTHVSVGADFVEGKLHELSVTPFPAAPNASLLSKARLAEYDGVEYELKPSEDGKGTDIYVGGEKVTTHEGTEDAVRKEAESYIAKLKEKPAMHEKLKKHLMDARKLSEEDADKLSKDMLAHHMAKMSFDDVAMTKHLESAGDEELKRMADEHDEDKKNLAAKGDEETEEEKGKKAVEFAAAQSEITRLAGAQKDITKLASDFRSGAMEFAKGVRFADAKYRFARLRAMGKVTPAELKKLDLTRFATMSQSEFDTAFSTYDNREPVINLGQLVGNAKAENVAKLSKEYKKAQEELTSRLNMPSKRKAALKRLAEEEDKIKALGEQYQGVGHEPTVPGQEPAKGALAKPSFEELCRMLDEGKHEELKAHLKHFVDGAYHMSDTSTMDEAEEKHMSSLAKRLSELQNQFEAIVKLAQPSTGHGASK